MFVGKLLLAIDLVPILDKVLFCRFRLDPHSSYMRFLAVAQLVVFWQITELNTFFLKHIFELPPSHMLNLWRLIVVGLIVAPSLRYVKSISLKAVLQ